MNSTVDGQGFLTTQNGDVKTCSGKLVVLMPSTNQNVALVKKWTSVSAILLGMGTNIKEGLNLGITETPEDYARANPNLKTVCDSTGNFSFSIVRPGDWIVATEILWVVSDSTLESVGIDNYQGGYVATRFKKTIFFRSNILVGP
jgi:hypothetical protein